MSKKSKSEIVIAEKLTNYPEIINELKELAKSYKNLVVTKVTLDESRKARLKLRERRYEIQNIQTANRNILNAVKRENGNMGDILIEYIFPTEDVIDIKIKRIEGEIEKERIEKKKKREEEVANQLKLLQNITGLTEKLINPEGVDYINEVIKEAEGLKITKVAYGKYKEDAELARGSFIEKAKSEIKRLELIEQEKEAKKVEDLIEARKEFRDYFPDEFIDVSQTAEQIREFIDADMKSKRDAQYEHGVKQRKERAAQEVQEEEKEENISPPTNPENAISKDELEKIWDWYQKIENAAAAIPEGFSDYGIKIAIEETRKNLEKALIVLGEYVK